MLLVADRFVLEEEIEHGARHAIDLATGARVILAIGTAGGASEQTRWSVRCDWLHRLHHRSIAPLVDFGIVGEASRFEAWACSEIWQGSPDVAGAVRERANRFFRSNGLTIRIDGREAVYSAQTGAVVLPDTGTGYRSPSDPSREAASLDACGIARIARPIVAALVEMFQAPCADRPHVTALAGPAGSGKTVIVSELARSARQHGFVPIASSLVGSRCAEAARGRSLFIIHRGTANGFSSFLRAITTTPQPHVLLIAGVAEARGVDTVVVERVDPDALIAAVRPDVEQLSVQALRAVRQAARRSRGLPGRFVQALWPDPSVHRGALRPPATSSSRAAERASVYGFQEAATDDVADMTDSASIASAWPAPGELATLRRRVETARVQLALGRHAPGIRHLRQAVGGLARRASWSEAAEGALSLAGALLHRGRARDAQAALEEAQGYAVRGGCDPLLVDIATLAGDAWVTLARLDEAERVLGGALAAAKAGGEPEQRMRASLSLARCLFWRGHYADAQTAIGVPPDNASPEVASRHARLASRIAVGQGDLRSAMSTIAEAKRQFQGGGDPGIAAAIAGTAAFVHLAVGDLDAVDRDLADSMSAARAAHDPLRGLKARLLLAEAERRRGRIASAQAQLDRLKRVSMMLPPLLRAQWDFSTALIEGADGREYLRRLTASTGLKALAFYLPSANAAHASSPSHATACELDDVVAILRACQAAEDEPAVLKDLCCRIRAQLHAAAVGVVTSRNGRNDVLVGDGPRPDSDIPERAIAAGIAIVPHRCGDRTEAAAPVQYGGAPIAALCARWTVGSTYDLSRAANVLTMAATAAAPLVSAVLVRRNQQPTAAALGGLIGVTPAMVELRRAIERAAAAPFGVLIDGESGSGKELVARAIHRLGARRDRAFSTLNCAALPDDLVEAELFGHARGSFTGAVSERPGVFEEAHGGTLFLDEIGELSLRAQAKVLRVIQEGELRRIGENAARRIDVRIVAATNRQLHGEVEAGRFRLDLLYRLDVIRITLPPLRERREDIALLAEHIWRDATERVGSRAALSAATIAALSRHDWPGNVRELQNVLAALAVRSPKRGVVPPTALPPVFGGRREESWRLDAARRIFDEQFVRAALVRTGGHRSRAAEELGVSRQGLTKLMTRLGIVSGEPPVSESDGG